MHVLTLAGCSLFWHQSRTLLRPYAESMQFLMCASRFGGCTSSRSCYISAISPRDGCYGIRRTVCAFIGVRLDAGCVRLSYGKLVRSLGALAQRGKGLELASTTTFQCHYQNARMLGLEPPEAMAKTRTDSRRWKRLWLHY